MAQQHRLSPSGPYLALEPSPVVANLTELAAYSELPDLVWVESLLCYWHRNATSTLAPDGITVIAAQPAGNWERMSETSSPVWRSIIVWTVDTTGPGDDEAAGDALAPLATVAEIRRRWGQERPHFDTIIVINVIGDVAEDVVLRADVSGAGIIYFNAVAPTIVVEGATIATAQSWNYATGANGQPSLVTSGDIVSWDAYRATSGFRLHRPVDDFYGWDMGSVAGVLSDGRVTLLGKEIAAPGPDGLTTANLMVGDVINIEKLQQLQGLTLDVQRLDFQPAVGAIAAVVSGWWIKGAPAGLARVNVQGQTGPVTSNGIAPLFLFCSIATALVGSGGGVALNMCSFQGANDLNVRVNGGGVAAPDTMQFRNCDVNLFGTITTSRLTVVNSKVYGPGSSLAVFDSSISGLVIDFASEVYIAQIYGDGAASFGIDVDGVCYYASGTPPKATGTGGDNLIGGVVVANGALPSITAANNAMIVALP